MKAAALFILGGGPGLLLVDGPGLLLGGGTQDTDLWVSELAKDVVCTVSRVAQSKIDFESGGGGDYKLGARRCAKPYQQVRVSIT